MKNIYLTILGWLESKPCLERCGSGNRTGAGSISAVGMYLCDAGEWILSHKEGEQATMLTEEEKGIYSVSFQAEINLRKMSWCNL